MAETPFCIRDGLQSCAWLLKTPCPVDRHIKRACALHSKGFMCILWRTCFILFHDLAQGCGRLDCGVFSKISRAFSQVFTRTLCGLCLKRYDSLQSLFPQRGDASDLSTWLHSCLQKACKSTLYGLIIQVSRSFQRLVERVL